VIWLRYVPFDRVAEFEAKGWKVHGPLGGNHGNYALLMVFEGEGEPG